MARSRNAPGAGHNSEPLTEQEQAALLQHHLVNIIRDERIAVQKKADYDAARAAVTKGFAACKGDLGFARKDLEEILAKMKMTEGEFRSSENARTHRMSLAGLPVGAQLDMFSGDTVDDAAEAEANGYRAGRRADDPVPPESIATMFHSDWLRGWTKGQDENGQQFALAKGILDKRAAAGAMTLEEPEDDRDPDEVIDDEARALKRAGWTAPTAAEEAIGAAA